MAKQAEAATVAALERGPRIVRMSGLACALLAALSFSACSLLPEEHAPNPATEPVIALVARTPNSMTFKFRAYARRGAPPAGLALWIGDKDHTIASPGAEFGTTTLESTPEGLIWTTEWPAEGVFSKAGHMRAGPIQLTDFAFRPDPLVWDAFGRLAVADGARPGQPKAAIYLSISNLNVGMK